MLTMSTNENYTDFQHDDYGYANITFPTNENIITLDLTFFGFTATSIIVLNSFLIGLVMIIGLKKITKNPFNIQILSLIISDIMVGVSLLPTQITYFTGQKSNIDCIIRCAVFMISYMASLLHVSLICLDRWWIIYFKQSNNNSKAFMFPRCIFLLFGTWIAAFIIEIIPFVLWHDETNEVCSIANVFGEFYNEAFGFQICTHLAVISCITVFYGLIIAFILKNRKRLNQIHINSSGSHLSTISSRFSVTGATVNPSQQSIKSIQTPARHDNNNYKHDGRQNKAIKTMGFIIGSHLLCVGPLITMLIMEIFGNQARASVSLHHVVIYIACLGSAINPILYALRVPEINARLIKFCRVNNAINE